MKGRVAALVLGLVLAASNGMREAAPLRPALECAAVDGSDAILANQARTTIVIDGETAAAVRAAGALACLAASRGERLLLVAEQMGAEDLGAHARRLAGGGAAAVLHVSQPAATARDDAAAAGEAAAAALETALQGVADRRIVAAAPPGASRGFAGLAGETWTPLAARLAPSQSVALRAEASAAPGMRVKLRPFEDIPAKGAALRYDGVIEIGPDVGATSNLRGR